MSDVKGFTKISMGAKRKSAPPERKRRKIHGCRVLPLRIALLDMKILELPVVYTIRDGEDLELLLKRRLRLITELKQETYE